MTHQNQSRAKTHVMCLCVCAHEHVFECVSHSLWRNNFCKSSQHIYSYTEIASGPVPNESRMCVCVCVLVCVCVSRWVRRHILSVSLWDRMYVYMRHDVCIYVMTQKGCVFETWCVYIWDVMCVCMSWIAKCVYMGHDVCICDMTSEICVYETWCVYTWEA